MLQFSTSIFTSEHVANFTRLILIDDSCPYPWPVSIFISYTTQPHGWLVCWHMLSFYMTNLHRWCYELDGFSLSFQLFSHMFLYLPSIGVIWLVRESVEEVTHDEMTHCSKDESMELWLTSIGSVGCTQYDSDWLEHFVYKVDIVCTFLFSSLSL